ncbi:MAG: hypothetical protein WCS52_03015 [bacterium]
MTINELSRDEKLALVALTEVAVISDRDITDNEVAQVEAIVDELGEDLFHELAEEAEGRFAERTALKAFLTTLTNPDARELIFGTVLNENLANTIPHEQAEFMDWLAATWNLRVDVQKGE